jgi:hypothetical protein
VKKKLRRRPCTGPKMDSSLGTWRRLLSLFGCSHRFFHANSDGANGKVFFLDLFFKRNSKFIFDLALQEFRKKILSLSCLLHLLDKRVDLVQIFFLERILAAFALGSSVALGALLRAAAAATVVNVVLKEFEHDKSNVSRLRGLLVVAFAN